MKKKIGSIFALAAFIVGIAFLPILPASSQSGGGSGQQGGTSAVAIIARLVAQANSWAALQTFSLGITSTVGPNTLSNNTIAGTNTYAGSNTFSTPPVAPGYLLPLTAASGGPGYVSYFQDFLDNSGTMAVEAEGSPTGDSCSTNAAATTVLSSTTFQAMGAMLAASGTVINTGVNCVYVGNIFPMQGPQLGAYPWTWEARVTVPSLPTATASAYAVGMNTGPPTSANWGSGYGFEMSTANSGFTSENDWACNSNGSLTDTGVAATVGAYNRLSMVQNGTNLSWYIDGTLISACTPVAVGSIVTTQLHLADFSSEALASASSVILYVDYSAFQRVISRTP
jgi:hypothetical protein